MFIKKVPTFKWPELLKNPYEEITPEIKKLIDETLKNKEIVCAIKYEDTEKIKYSIKGLRNLRDDIRVMLGPKYTDNFTYYIWCALWGFISPALCVVI